MTRFIIAYFCPDFSSQKRFPIGVIVSDGSHVISRFDQQLKWTKDHPIAAKKTLLALQDTFEQNFKTDSLIISLPQGEQVVIKPSDPRYLEWLHQEHQTHILFSKPSDAIHQNIYEALRWHYPREVLEKEPTIVSSRVLNLLLLLYFLGLSGPVRGKTKLMKAVFACEFNHENESYIGFKFRYKHWDYGPFSDELAQELDRLESIRIIKSDYSPIYNNHTYIPLEIAEEIIDFASEFLDERREALQTIEEIAPIIRRVHWEKLTEVVKATALFQSSKYGEYLLPKEQEETTFTSLSQDKANLLDRLCLIYSHKELMSWLEEAKSIAKKEGEFVDEKKPIWKKIFKR